MLFVWSFFFAPVHAIRSPEAKGMCVAPMDPGGKQERFAGPRALFLEGVNEIRGYSFSHHRVRGMTTRPL
jgi:hypothetical protein